MTMTMTIIIITKNNCNFIVYQKTINFPKKTSNNNDIVKREKIKKIQRN